MQPRQFGRAHSLKGMAVVEGAAGLHLGDDQGVAVEGNNVDFAFGAAPVPLHHQHAQRFKIAGGELLAAPAQQVFGFHFYLRNQPAGAGPRRTGS